MANCLICGSHVQTGDGLLVISGEVTGDQTFEAEDVEGVIHRVHVNQNGRVQIESVEGMVFKI